MNLRGEKEGERGGVVESDIYKIFLKLFLTHYSCRRRQILSGCCGNLLRTILFLLLVAARPAECRFYDNKII